MGFFSVQNQTSESHGNGKTTLEDGGRNPPDVTLDDIAKDLLAFFNRSECLRKTNKKNIEEKYDIKNEYGDYWSADDIKRAWGKTQRMDKKSDKRKHWARVIILQMLKRLVYDGCKQNAAQDDHDDTINEIKQSCEKTPRIKENSEDISSQSNDELKIWRAGLRASKHKLTERSSAVSESQLSASSTDVAPSPAELREKICYAHSNSNESMNAALANENKDTRLTNCEQRKSIDNHEQLNFTDTPDQRKAESENGRGEGGLWSTDGINQACGKAGSIKGKSEDRSTQSKAELETVEAAGADKQSSGANLKSTKSGLSQAGSASQDRSGTQLQDRSQATRNDPGAPGGRSRSGVSTTSEQKETVDSTVNETKYIRIPVTAMFGNEQTVTEDGDENDRSQYKLIDGFPSNTDLRIRKSYAMSFSNQTKNAEWVYEILNRQILEDNCKKLKPFGNDYHKGHLAAAANHRWCQEAINDANLFSNIIPQNKKLNQGMWKKLENYCRKKQHENSNCNVHVYTGPLYLRSMNPSVLGGKRVPSHLFKVLIVEEMNGTVKEPECYVIANRPPRHNDLKSYSKDIEIFQSVSGLTFIDRRPNGNMREHKKTVTLQGEGGNEEPRSVNVHIRISS